MRVMILTSHRRGLASRCLPFLSANPSLELAGVVLVASSGANRTRRLARQLRKLRRIGVLGALNGVRMRPWFSDEHTDPIDVLCSAYGVPLVEATTLRAPATVEIVDGLHADLGISLGNGYIPRRVFTVPAKGMINVHTELLPEFPGAQSVIWPIYEGCPQTGFSVHRISAEIDKGEILLQGGFDITFKATLRETVEWNLAKTRTLVPPSLSHLCENYEAVVADACSGSSTASYTTPTFHQFLVMLRNHARMSVQPVANAGPPDAS